MKTIFPSPNHSALLIFKASFQKIQNKRQLNTITTWEVKISSFSSFRVGGGQLTTIMHSKIFKGNLTIRIPAIDLAELVWAL